MQFENPSSNPPFHSILTSPGEFKKIAKDRGKTERMKRYITDCFALSGSSITPHPISRACPGLICCCPFGANTGNRFGANTGNRLKRNRTTHNHLEPIREPGYSSIRCLPKSGSRISSQALSQARSAISRRAASPAHAYTTDSRSGMECSLQIALDYMPAQTRELIDPQNGARTRMKALVTGITGMVGSHFAAACRAGVRIRWASPASAPPAGRRP